MTAPLFERAKAILAEVDGLDGPARAARIDSLCAGDADLIAEVASLLTHLDAPDRRLTAAPGVRDLIGCVAGSGGHPAGPDDPSALIALEELPVVEGSLTPGARLGRFTLERRLGAGGMGVVFEAVQDEPHRRVALKVLGSGPVSRELLARFRHEVHVLGRLEHPGIASLFEAGAVRIDDGLRPFFAMQLVRGVPLTHWVREHEPSPEQVVTLVAQVCDAVAHAHARGVVHRDLKPANILVDDEGRPTVLDFGVARLTDAHTRLSSLHTERGQVLGTLPYMSPEQVSGDVDAVDARTDVYALGVLLFEALTDELPLDVAGLPLPAAALVIERKDPPRLSRLVPELAGDLDVLVDTALAKEPVRRYPDAAGMAADLRRFLGGRSLVARPVSTLGQLLRTARRHRVATAGLAVAFLSLVVALAISLDQIHVAREALGEALQEADRARIVGAAAALAAREPRAALDQLRAVSPGARGWEWRYEWQRLHGTRLEVPASPDLREVAFADDGTIVELSADGEVRWRSPTDGAVVRRLQLDAGDLQRAELSRNGARALAVVHEDGREQIVLWDLAEGGRMARFTLEGPLTRLVIEPQGRTLAWVTDERAVIAAEDGRVLAETSLRRKKLHAIQSAMEDATLLIGGQFGGASLLDGQEPEAGLQRAYQQFGTRTEALAISPDGTRFALSSLDGVVKVVQRGAPERALVLGSHSGPVTTMVFLGAGDRLVSAAKDGVIRLWDVDVPRELGAWPTGDRELSSLCVDRSQRLLLARTPEGEVLVWELDRSAECDVLTGHDSYIYDVAVTADGRAVSASWDGTVRWWDTLQGEPLRVTDVGGRCIVTAPSPDGRWLAVRSEGRLVLVPEDEALPEIEVEGSFPRAQAMVWDRAGTQLLVGAVLREEPVGGTVEVVDGRTGAVVDRHEIRGYKVRALDLAPDGDMLALGSSDGDIGLWSWPEVRQVASLPGHDQLVVGLAFSPDGSRLLSSSGDGTARILDLATGSLEHELTGHPDKLWDAAWSPDGTRVATACHDGIVRLFDASDGALVAQLRGHDDYVHALVFTPDGETLVTGSGDGTLRLWHTRPLHERIAGAR